jgi:hypothetical protein
MPVVMRHDMLPLDATWTRFLAPLHLDGPHGRMFKGILVFDKCGNILFEDGWFLDRRHPCVVTHEDTLALFETIMDDQMRSHIVSLGKKNIFHIVKNEFGNIGAVGAHRRMGLITQRFSIGAIVVVFQWPYTLQTTFQVMEDFGQRLRMNSSV